MTREEGQGSLLLAWQVNDKHCLVIGSGDVALSRVKHLLRARAKITILSGEKESGMNSEIIELHKQGKIFNLVNRNYDIGDLSMYEKMASEQQVDWRDYKKIQEIIKEEMFAVVCCCIDDHDLSEQIYYQCKVKRLPVNVADRPPLCDFYFGSMINQDALQIMISTNGKSPRLLKIIKDEIEKQFRSVDLSRAVDNLGIIRARLRERIVTQNDETSIESRMHWIKSLTDRYSIRQWSELPIVDDEVVDRIVRYYPGHPPSDFQEFKSSIFDVTF